MRRQIPGKEAAEATAAQLRALSHPTRVQLWVGLAGGEATISQLSARLGLNKGSVSHHLRVLVAAGLARPTATRTVRGGTEQYYSAENRPLTLPSERGDETAGRTLMRQVLSELLSAEERAYHVRRVRLTPEQAEALTAHLDAVLSSLTSGDQRQAAYGVLTAVYRID